MCCIHCVLQLLEASFSWSDCSKNVGRQNKRLYTPGGCRTCVAADHICVAADQICVAADHMCVAADGGVFFCEYLLSNVGCQNNFCQNHFYEFLEDIGCQKCVAADQMFVAADRGVFLCEYLLNNIGCQNHLYRLPESSI